MPEIFIEKEESKNQAIDEELESLLQKQSTRVKVIGCGGGGGNCVSRMKETGIKGCEIIAVNTDAQDLLYTNVDTKILIGRELTHGLGAGSNPKVGEQAARESEQEIRKKIADSDMVFITCGLGGGTGTGASPVIAEIAKDSGALTIGVVTKPFSFEGAQRRQLAEEGWAQLKERVDALIVIPNDRILQIIDRNTSLIDAFAKVDDVLRQGVQGISNLITYPGIINVDFADIRAIMQNAGSALMGIGSATGEDRAIVAAKAAINSPLLELSIDGAKGVLFSISGGQDLGMLEVNEAAKVITESIDSDAKIIFGAIHDDKLKKGEIKVTVIATGFDEGAPVKTVSLPLKINGAANAETEKKAPSEELFRQSADHKTKKIVSSDSDLKDETEWDIPTFIRKKMK